MRGRRSSWASDSRPKTSATPPTAACLRSNWRRCRTRASTRLFEISGRTPAPLGKSNNYSRTVAQRIGADPARAILEPIGGQGPQHLVTEFASAIAAGSCGVVMLFGSENTSSLRFFEGRADKPDQSETVEGSLEDRGYGSDGIFDEYTIAHGLLGAPVQYGLLENARRARLGLSVADYRQRMGELFAPFTTVAAKNPFSSSPVERTVDELTTVTEGNRMICDPYPRLLLARDQVNEGAAVLLMSVEAARRLGVPQEKWVYLRGHADLVEQKLLGCVDVSTSPASIMAVREALSVAGTGLDDVATFDLYGVHRMRRYGPGHRRRARAHLDRWAAVLRRPRQQLIDARHRRDRQRNAAKAWTIRPRRCEWRDHEQVLGRRLLDRACRLGAR